MGGGLFFVGAYARACFEKNARDAPEYRFPEYIACHDPEFSFEPVGCEKPDKEAVAFIAENSDGKFVRPGEGE